ncbi:hypothetical protein [Streptomyces sp. NPDC002044]|uniref:hypothetical protein n=1 Tax=Streptomyces sp. NPDC002044 TaxID=3154662 RepID=UPI00331BD7DA
MGDSCPHPARPMRPTGLPTPSAQPVGFRAASAARRPSRARGHPHDAVTVTALMRVGGPGHPKLPEVREYRDALRKFLARE